jgi:hypothetical protein
VSPGFGSGVPLWSRGATRRMLPPGGYSKRAVMPITTTHHPLMHHPPPSHHATDLLHVASVTSHRAAEFACGANSSTLERNRPRAPQIGESKRARTTKQAASHSLASSHQCTTNPPSRHLLTSIRHATAYAPPRVCHYRGTSPRPVCATTGVPRS